MTRLRLSVAMCTCNGAAYLQDQLDSLACQDRLPDELVISDDASTDETAAIVERFARTAPFPVVLHVNETNLGFRRNLENAVRRTTGDVVFPADHDDVWKPQKIAATAAVFEQSPQTGLVLCDSQIVDQDLSPKGYRGWQRFGFNDAAQEQFASGAGFEVLLRHNFVGGPTMAWRGAYRSLVLPVPRWWFPDAWMALLVAAVSQTDLVREPLFLYRQSQTQMAGAARKSLAQKYREARAAVRGPHFTRLIKRHLAARRRLERADDAGIAARPGAIEGLDELIALTLARREMRRRPLRRIPLIAQQLARGRYHRFAHRWRTAAFDLLV